MSKVLINDTTLNDIANSIRVQLGEDKYYKEYTINSMNYIDGYIDYITPDTKDNILHIYVDGGNCNISYGYIDSDNVWHSSKYSSFTTYTYHDLMELDVFKNNYLSNVKDTDNYKYRISIICQSSTQILSVKVLTDIDYKMITYKPSEISDAISLFSILTEDKFIITDNASHRFDNRYGWTWFLTKYMDKITTENLTDISGMFYQSILDKIDFDLYGKAYSTANLSSAFSDCGNLTNLPNLYSFRVGDIQNMFTNCYSLLNIDDDYFDNLDFSMYKVSTYSCYSIFSNCYSLRKVPMNLFKYMDLGYKKSSWSQIPWNLAFLNCYVLDEVVDMPVYTTSLTGSMLFYNIFNLCGRLKRFTFETNEDGSAKTATWNNGTLNLSNGVGFISNASYITDYNSGLTTATQISDDTTYQALKDNEDSWTTLSAYSRYNHDSALETINSLPDCSATGTNTIKFTGKAGASTDGGAINTLTEEEIAVATAKGWTVTLA